MASESSIIKNIDENFCQCPFCLEQFKEPKQLPCLHRYCSECLRQLLVNAQGVLKCPECREECEIPETGVDGFKTDFYMKSIVDFIQLQISVQDEQIRECFSCSKRKQLSAYCFKCNDFLCEECHNHHVTGKMMKDHRSHVLSIGEVEFKNISFEKLVSLKDVTRCQSHPENISQLCCTTCGNLPICVACSLGNHKDHVIIDVISLASTERDGLTEKLGLLQECKGTLDNMITKVSKLYEQIISNASEETRKVQSKYEDKVEEIEAKRNKIREKINTEKTEIRTNYKERNSVLKENMKKEIKEIKDKYDKLFETERKKSKTSLNKLEENLKNEESKLDGKRDLLERKVSYVIKLIGAEKEKKLKRNKEIVQHFANTAKRYHNLTSTAASILSAKNDWTSVNCIPDIISAINPLMKDVSREFPELNEISNFGVTGSSLVNLDTADSVTISHQAESVINIGYDGSKMFKVYDITYNESENIVVSGEIGEPADEKHITVLSMDGTIMKQDVTKSDSDFTSLVCASLSKFKVTAASTANEIVVVDINTGLHITRNIKDIVTSWERDQKLVCMDADSSKNRIYVGFWTGERSLIHAFDDQLNLCHSLKLPLEVGNVIDVTHCEGNFFVCHFTMKTVYRLDMEGNVLSELKYMPEENWGPLDVCTDKNGFIYTLWSSISQESSSSEEGKSDSDENDGESGSKNLVESSDESGDESDNSEEDVMIVVQYSQDGSNILAITPVKDISCMTIYERNQEEKLLLAAADSRKFWVYSLKEMVSS